MTVRIQPNRKLNSSNTPKRLLVSGRRFPAIEAAATPPSDDRGLGFSQTIRDIEDRLKNVRHHLEATGVECHAVTDEPVRFDLTDECVSTYAEAVARTESRFWVSTYHGEGFWSNPDAKVLEANSQLVSRNGLKGNLRRVFMMESPLEQHLAGLREELMFLRRRRRFPEISAKGTELVRLTENIRAQQESGFEVRVGHDPTTLTAWCRARSASIPWGPKSPFSTVSVSTFTAASETVESSPCIATRQWFMISEEFSGRRSSTTMSSGTNLSLSMRCWLRCGASTPKPKGRLTTSHTGWLNSSWT